MVRDWPIRYQHNGLTEGENEDMAEMARGMGNNPTLRGLLGLVSPGQV